MKKKFLALLLSLMFVFSICVNAADLSFKKGDVINQNSRSYIEFSKLSDYGLKTEKKGTSYTISDGNATLVFKENSSVFTVNNTPFTMDTKTIEKKNELLIPLRILFETLNYKVSWNKNTKSIAVEKLAENKLPVKANDYTITKHHNKVVSLAPSVTETFFDLGAEKMLLGRSEYCNYPKAALSLPSVGSLKEPSLEKIVSLKPTAVIAQTHYKEEVLNELKKANIEVIAMDTPKTMEETYEIIKKIGLILDKNYEARALCSTMNAKLETVAMKTKKLSKPSVYIVVGTGQYGEYTHGKDSFMNGILTVAGYTNAPTDAEGFSYTLEKLIQKDPYYILTPSFATEAVKTEKAYKGLSAVKNGRVIEIDADIFSRPSRRVVDDGLKVLLKIAHPEVLKTLEF